MFWLSGNIIRAVGTKSVLTLTVLSYVVRFVMYASITRGWHAIPAEILRGLTFAIFWSAATTHVYDISPKGLSATMVSAILTCLLCVSCIVAAVCCTVMTEECCALYNVRARCSDINRFQLIPVACDVLVFCSWAC
jgi:hypothetical protein